MREQSGPQEMPLRDAREAFARVLQAGQPCWITKLSDMKIKNSLKSLRLRHRDNRLIRRRGRVYIINKTQRRYKARQG